MDAAAYFRAFLTVLLVTAVAACSSLRSDFVKNPSVALPAAIDTPSARYIQSELSSHQDLSGFRLLANSTNALMSRIALIDHATHCIDLQYYIFQNDMTGRLVAQRLLAAADRGVRVRMLLDDIDLDHEDHLLDALDAHANIEVRLFNPFRTRDPSMPSKIMQFVLEGRRLNRRMHNKSFIVDNSAAILGGRNIGDSYFDAGKDTSFRDLDVVAIGPVVAEASRAFDDYWNSDAAYPVDCIPQFARYPGRPRPRPRPSGARCARVRAVRLRAGLAGGASARCHRRPSRRMVLGNRKPAGG